MDLFLTGASGPTGHGSGSLARVLQVAVTPQRSDLLRAGGLGLGE